MLEQNKCKFKCTADNKPLPVMMNIAKFMELRAVKTSVTQKTPATGNETAFRHTLILDFYDNNHDIKSLQGTGR